MKVLISDDDATSRMLMRSLLQKKLGYEVFETTDGLQAWQILDSGMAADLCILDMWMPKMTGVDLVRKLRSDPRFQRQKVILCSAENGRSAILKVASLGISAYLIKPFVADQFLTQVRKACEGAKTASGNGALEPTEAVLGRLGIGRGAYLELIDVFTRDVATLIAELRKPRANTNKGEMQTRLSGLRGAGGSLGAAALVAALLRLEKLGPEAGLSAIRSCVESLQMENERVVAAMAVIASQGEPPGNKPPEQNPKPAPAENPKSGSGPPKDAAKEKAAAGAPA
ncbi:MAG: response regulator [Verrucomicrobiota bacterium]|jgi:two-component system chemotaxis response regulator CheY